MRNHYGNVPIYITENGISDRNGSLHDDHRIFYYKHYINNVLKGNSIFYDITHRNIHEKGHLKSLKIPHSTKQHTKNLKRLLRIKN